MAASAEGEALTRLVWAEALHACGEHPSARQVIAAARRRLLERAGRIRGPAVRRAFLEDVVDNARTLALADAWLG